MRAAHESKGGSALEYRNDLMFLPAASVKGCHRIPEKTQWEDHEGERREGPPNSHDVRVAHKRVELARPAEPMGASPKDIRMTGSPRRGKIRADKETQKDCRPVESRLRPPRRFEDRGNDWG
ncbi:hypothetical protein V9T40_008223 [Parthenolecanium corni]|uniref:Uncharacterized protein n=1 Tax=Parthenolecanium corni TaxID=536013 RepID=A0AAN9Y7N1_9HEMI